MLRGEQWSETDNHEIPKMYRELTRKFKKDIKKKAREEKKRKKEISRFKLVTSTTPR